MLSFIAIGDICFAGKVADILTATETDTVFSEVQQDLHQADFVFGNFEGVINKPGKNEINSTRRHTPLGFHIDAADCLSASNVKIVSLANNHVMDYGADGLHSTISYLNKAGIKTVGAGQNIHQARSPVVIEGPGIKIGFLANALTRDNATARKSGVAGLNPRSLEKEIRLLKSDCDLVVVSLHAGVEFKSRPENYMRSISRSLVEHGCDIVLGTHPHSVQGIEEYKNGLIAYSLGNFVFDPQILDHAIEYDNPLIRNTYMLKMSVNNQGITDYSIIPIVIDDRGIPRKPVSTTALQIQQEFQSNSLALSESHPKAETEESFFKTSLRSLLKQSPVKSIKQLYRNRSFITFYMKSNLTSLLKSRRIR